MSAELMKSKFVRRPSVVCRPSSACGIDYLWSYGMDFFQILVVACPSPYVQTLFFSFWKTFFLFFYEYFSFSLTWDPMWVKTLKRYSSLKSLLNPFKLFLKFLLSGLYKSTVLDFWNFEFLIFQAQRQAPGLLVFVSCGGSEIFEKKFKGFLFFLLLLLSQNFSFFLWQFRASVQGYFWVGFYTVNRPVTRKPMLTLVS